MNDEEFENLVAEGIDAVPEEHAKFMENVAIVYADDPTPEQKDKLCLRDHALLLGLYEGIPKVNRQNYNLALPDKITIFKNPIIEYCGGDPERIKFQVAKTIQHEIAHHFGFNEQEVRAHGL